jgi:hypothetical protein
LRSASLFHRRRELTASGASWSVGVTLYDNII